MMEGDDAAPTMIEAIRLNRQVTWHSALVQFSATSPCAVPSTLHSLLLTL